MASPCAGCGGQRSHIRASYELWFPDAQLLMEEVPSVRCEACDRNEPAGHIRPQVDAVIALAEDVSGATMRKDFSSAPLHPDDSGGDEEKRQFG